MSTLREILAQAGFEGSALDTAVAVAMAESGGHPTAHNSNASTGDDSYGLFQINMLGTMGPARLREFGLHSKDQLLDPLVNAKVAYRISDGGTNWQPWTTFTGGAYRAHLGDNPATDLGSGSEDTRELASNSPESTSATHYDRMDAGTPLSAAQGQPGGSHDTLVNDMRVALGLDPLGGTPTESATHVNADPLHRFLDAAVAQRGDPYVFGAKGALHDPDPKAFDCSGLTKWAAQQAGLELPDGAAHQYLALKAQGMVIPVDQAIHTPGALLFHFASEPESGDEPSDAHVAISLGNGKTIEAANPRDGVNEFNAGGGRFDFAAVLPGISDSGDRPQPLTTSDFILSGEPGATATPSSAGPDLVEQMRESLGLGPSSGHDGGVGSGLGLGSGHSGTGADTSHDGTHPLDSGLLDH